MVENVRANRGDVVYMNASDDSRDVTITVVALKGNVTLACGPSHGENIKSLNVPEGRRMAFGIKIEGNGLIRVEDGGLDFSISGG